MGSGPRLRGRGLAFSLVVLGWILLLSGAWLYRDLAPNISNIIEFEVSGSSAAADENLISAGARYRSALIWDSVVLIPAYVAWIAIVCFTAWPIFLSKSTQAIAKAAAIAGIAAGSADIAENMSLLAGTTNQGVVADDRPFQLGAMFATIKFGLLLVAATVTIVATTVVVKRSVGSLIRNVCSFQKMASKILLPWPSVNTDGTIWPASTDSASPSEKGTGTDETRTGIDEKSRPWWSDIFRKQHRENRPVPHGHNVDSYLLPEGRNEAKVGFCLSGGGIRAAAVVLGALQSLRPQLQEARYLVSVSGGGYAAGAMQLALKPDPDEETDQETGRVRDAVSIATPPDVYAAGTVEEDHTRRHGNYIAEGAAEWTAALARILRGLIASIAIAAAFVVSVGLLLSHGYQWVPLVDLSVVFNYLSKDGCPEVPCLAPPFPEPLGYGAWTLLWVAIAAVVCWLISTACVDEKGLVKTYKFFRTASLGLATLGGILVLLLFGLPAATWGAASLSWAARSEGGPDGEAVGGAAGTFAFTYIAALVSIAWRRRKNIGGVVDKLRGALGKKGDQKEGVAHAVANGLVQYAIVWLALAILLVVGLILLGITIASGHDWNRWVQVGIPLGLVAIYATVDQTWMSLHPFYRRRLATAFSVRRVQINGRMAARAYDFDKEGTPLAIYGKKNKGFPQVIFAGAANLSGPDRTPPGRRAISYTMSYDAIGGPDIGYLPTRELGQNLSGPLSADLTVQAAVAISGAAFASAMGRHAAAFQTLLALSNVRLGTWLPNPAYLSQLSSQHPDWRLPTLPRIRRLTYLAREVFGRYSHEQRLLLVTDGGHYDNLGLVEILRHKCRTVFCIDASGDTPPFPQTLYEAITLAYEELGIRIELSDEEYKLHPGTAVMADDDPLSSMKSRLSEIVAVKGTITYPFNFKLEGEEEPSDRGTLIFAKALLARDMPGELLAYAQATPIFPRDETGDQWFTQDQFDNYLGLGRHVGQRAASLYG
jgi:hypothetical protein